MTIPKPNATDAERAELAMAFAERFVAFWDNVPKNPRERLAAVARLVAELVIHASASEKGLGYPSSESNVGLRGHAGWKETVLKSFPGEIGMYSQVEPPDLDRRPPRSRPRSGDDVWLCRG